MLFKEIGMCRGLRGQVTVLLTSVSVVCGVSIANGSSLAALGVEDVERSSSEDDEDKDDEESLRSILAWFFRFGFSGVTLMRVSFI